MELLVDCVLRNALTLRKDQFGEECVFVKFELDNEDYDWTSGMQSSFRFGRIVFQRDGKVQHSDHLALKVTPPRLYMKEFSPLQFSNEAFFYTRIVPFFAAHRAIDHLFPRYYNSLLQYNVESDEVLIVFENVQARGYLTASKKSFLDYDHLALMLQKLGEFHAYSYRAKHTDADKFYALTSNALETNMVMLKEYKGVLYGALERGFEPLLNDSRYNAHSQKLRKLMDDYEEIVRSVLSGDEQNHTHVLCHGDFLRNNVLFKYEDGKPVDLKLVDMATWRFASPTLDLALVLYLNADQKMRERNWDKLIDVYYSSLQNTFPSSEVPSKDSILAEFRTRSMHAYAIASFFLPILIEDDHAGNEERLVLGEYRKILAEDNDKFDIVKEMWPVIGGEKATVALTDILKDMINRGFL